MNEYNLIVYILLLFIVCFCGCAYYLASELKKADHIIDRASEIFGKDIRKAVEEVDEKSEANNNDG